MASWVRREGPDGSVFVDITRLTDGRVMCCLCFDYKSRTELHEIEPGVVTDVCEACWVLDLPPTAL